MWARTVEVGRDKLDGLRKRPAGLYNTIRTTTMCAPADSSLSALQLHGKVHVLSEGLYGATIEVALGRKSREVTRQHLVRVWMVKGKTANGTSCFRLGVFVTIAVRSECSSRGWSLGKSSVC